ncbi:MAG: signal peptidase II [Bdellovibrionales bacterium]|nr:signal peptidase II [Bdellovibrionales bacterium]
MKKRDWLLVISLVPSVWLIDQLTKYWANHYLTDLVFYGPFGFVLHHNPGAILGTFADLPPILRVVSLSTGGAFLIFIYAAIQYLLPSRSLQLRAGMSLLLGGILGNVTDRIVSGAVTDFLLLGSRQLSSPAFNFADAIQWVGYGLVVYGLVRDGSLFWPDSNVRKTVWVNPRYQLKYSLTIVAIGTCFAVVAGVFAFTFLKITIDDLVVGPAKMMERRFLVPFIYTYLTISVGFMLTLFVLGRILSHRTAGPIYAFEHWLRDMMKGKDRPFRVRKGDEFKELEELAESLRPLLAAAVLEMKEAKERKSAAVSNG